MSDPLFSSTPAPSNFLSDLHLNINLNPETMVHGDTYNVKYTQPDTLDEPVLFEHLKHIRVNHAVFKVTSFVNFGLI